MARGRMISKSLGTSERFAMLFQVAGDLAEFAQSLYPLLVTHSDDFGRQAADLFTIKHRVHPASPRGLCDFKQALIALHNVGLIIWYDNGSAGGKCLQIQQFDKHQFGLHKRTRSEFPRPPVEASGNFREFPGSTGTTELNRTELNRTEEKRDLASSEDLDVLPDLASTRIPTRAREETAVMAAPTNPPPVWNPSGVAKRFSPLLGNHTGCYPSDGCGRGLCVPGWLGAQWAKQFQDFQTGAQHIAAFVAATLSALPLGAVVGDKPYKFWVSKWEDGHPSYASAPRISGKGDATKAAMQRVLAKFAVRGQAS